MSEKNQLNSEKNQSNKEHIKKIVFTCPLLNGLHARPATHIDRACKPFSSSITWHNLRNNRKADAKSVLSLISSNTLYGDECHLVIEGADEDEAFVTLQQFIKQDFPFCDENICSEEKQSSVNKIVVTDKHALTDNVSTDICLTENTANNDIKPLLSKTCMTINPDWNGKEQVIKGMTDKLKLNGRCCDSHQLASDIWAREAIFSTALGHGFAIPHTKSAHIEHSTISVAKLSSAIVWGDEGEEVNFVIMLTLNKYSSCDDHMRIFSKLARKIIHETFRTLLQNASDEAQLEYILKQELDL